MLSDGLAGGTTGTADTQPSTKALSCCKLCRTCSVCSTNQGGTRRPRRPARRFGAGGESGPGQWRDRHGVILVRNLRRRWIHSPVCKAQRFKHLAVNQKVLSAKPVWGGRYFRLRNSLRLPVNEGAAFSGANGPCYADADSL